MLIWFAAPSVVLVAIVFRSPAIDYRTVVVGALLPLVESLFGGPRLLHSIVGAVGIMGLVMVATRNRRLVRRRLLGIPIGLMCHLVLDGSFTLTDVFWWPISGTAFAPGQIPELSHLGLSLVLEVLGIAVAVWAYRRFGLDDPAKRHRFVADGRLDLPV
ncbi:MAG: hypothetical protein JWM47_1004 [Acidimicrobiales bacterium]|nr:hypothetical protein [Acidimicrobiales bacterium]